VIAASIPLTLADVLVVSGFGAIVSGVFIAFESGQR
jgi:paraquat-inducible protein B